MIMHVCSSNEWYISVQDIAKLKEIFPNETEAALEDVLDDSLNVEEAIDTLVNKATGQYQYEVTIFWSCTSVGYFL